MMDDGQEELNESLVLEEEIDENYEPTEKGFSQKKMIK